MFERLEQKWINNCCSISLLEQYANSNNETFVDEVENELNKVGNFILATHFLKTKVF